MTALRIFAIEPYFGGSHAAFLRFIQLHSQHDWSLLTEPARHWKWRMRSAPLPLADRAMNECFESGPPDVIFCSDMLDVPSWLGILASQFGKQETAGLLRAPIVTYFHENQWTYPQSPKARVDFHYGYTNLLTAIVSQACWFNSQYHLDEFIAASDAFIARMPDTRAEHDTQAIREKSIVVPPGFADDATSLDRNTRTDNMPLRIGWVSRWEYDKRPDRFLQLLQSLRERCIVFELILLGERKDDRPELVAIRQQFANQIIVDEFAPTRQAYLRHLNQMDIVVSTADHEFFGIAICEAIAAGAAPVLPDRLSYPKLIAPNRCYGDLEEAVQMIGDCRSEASRKSAAVSAVQSIQCYRAANVMRQIDDQLTRLADTATSS